MVYAKPASGFSESRDEDTDEGTWSQSADDDDSYEETLLDECGDYETSDGPTSDDEFEHEEHEANIARVVQTELQRNAGKKRYFCHTCRDLSFGRHHDLRRHVETVHRSTPSEFICVCGPRAFSRKDALKVLSSIAPGFDVFLETSTGLSSV